MHASRAGAAWHWGSPEDGGDSLWFDRGHVQHFHLSSGTVLLEGGLEKGRHLTRLGTFCSPFLQPGMVTRVPPPQPGAAGKGRGCGG